MAECRFSTISTSCARALSARCSALHTNPVEGFAVLLQNAFIAGAILTPSPDPFNQAMYAAPMFALYLLSIGVAWLAHPNR